MDRSPDHRSFSRNRAAFPDTKPFGAKPDINGEIRNVPICNDPIHAATIGDLPDVLRPGRFALVTGCPTALRHAAAR
jgi:hypothetical protein